MKIKDLYEEFIKDCKYSGLASGTIAEHASLFKRIIIPALGELELVELLPVHVNEIARVANSYGKSAHRHAILSFRRLVRLAKKHRWPVGVEAGEIEIPFYRKQADVCA
jgi:hypothetical protein